MAVVSGGGSGGRLNPWAEPFVPAGTAEVDDFSPEWWRLVAVSPAFRDRWLSDYAALDLLDEAADGFLPDDLLSPPPARHDGGEGKKGDPAGKRGGGLEVAPWGIEKWWRAHGGPPEAPRYAEKAPRKVTASARVSPRPIQQPR